jgi:hypothetical protein
MLPIGEGKPLVSQQIPDGSVVITPAEMYKEQRATHDAVLKLTGAVETLAKTGSSEARATAAELADHRTRLRKVELKLAWYSGGAAVVGAAAGLLAGLLGSGAS